MARIDSKLESNELALLRRMMEALRAVISEVPGAETVEETTTLDLSTPAHVSGTCRMGSDRCRSVADADGICHTVPNLAFADASLLSTDGSGDSPSLTIQALAVRTADKLRARLT